MRMTEGQRNAAVAIKSFASLDWLIGVNASCAKAKKPRKFG